MARSGEGGKKIMNKLIRTIHPEVRIIDRAKGLVDYIASDETLDHYREIIRATGWRFTYFKKNAPFVDSHHYYTIGNLLGKILDFKVAGKQLVERVQWAIDTGSDLAKLGWDLTVGGYLKAVSVGFIPKRVVTKWDNDPSNFQSTIAEMGISAEEAAVLRAIYLEQEQIELSACIIGANPNALAKAHIDGVAKDETLEKLGFDDNGLQFLHESAAAYENATPAQQAVIRFELGRITSRQSGPDKTFRQDNAPHRAASPDNGADDEAAIQRRRKAFLAELKTATQPKD